MNLICLRCMSKGTVSLLLEDAPRFTCTKCGQTYGSAEARAEIAQIRECWEKVLAWAETMPKTAVPPALAPASAPAPIAPTKPTSPTKASAPPKPSLPKPNLPKPSLPKPPPPRPGGAPRSS